MTVEVPKKIQGQRIKCQGQSVTLRISINKMLSYRRETALQGAL